MSTLEIRAVPVEEILDLRWHVLRPGRPRESAHLPGDDAPDTRHWAVFRGDRVVACVTVMRQEGPDGPAFPFRLRGMAVAEDLQGTGVGGRLLDHVQAEVGAPMWCDARLRAVPFYARHGWRVVSDVYEVPLVGPHRRMVRP